MNINLLFHELSSTFSKLKLATDVQTLDLNNMA
jgi:hypothetical protein